MLTNYVNSAFCIKYERILDLLDLANEKLVNILNHMGMEDHACSYLNSTNFITSYCQKIYSAFVFKID